MTWVVHLADCAELLRSLPAESVDACVTDPPYGLSAEPDIAEVLQHWLAGDDYHHRGGGFMSKSWDSFVPGPATWREVYRVLKPGAHVLAFFGTRTQDMGSIALRLAGFEIRDCLSWLYGQGFPKSLNVGKAVNPLPWRHPGDFRLREAAGWSGHGSALKPSWEPIVLARKPLTGTVAGNVLEHGTGALNVDGCRIAGPPSGLKPYTRNVEQRESQAANHEHVTFVDHPAGRWPANVVLAHTPNCRQVGTRRVKSDGHFPAARPAGSQTSGPSGHAGQDGLAERHMRGEVQEAWSCDPSCPVRLLDEQSGELQVAGNLPGSMRAGRDDGRTQHGVTWGEYEGGPSKVYADRGGASRFFATFKQQEEPWSEYASSAAGGSMADAANDSAAGDALDSPQLAGEDSAPSSDESARRAGDPSTTTPPTGQDGSAPKTAPTLPDGSSIRHASGAANPSRSTTTGSAHGPAPAEHRTAGSRQAGPPSTPEPKPPTPTPSHAPIAAPQASTGTTSNTSDPKTSCGSAPAVTPPATPLDGAATDGDLTRFRYVPKSSSAERNAGLDGFPEKATRDTYNDGLQGPRPHTSEDYEWQRKGARNTHPTVKPIDLMRWLVRLVCPPGGVVLDPFTGSGTTGIAAVLEGFEFVGIEREAEYHQIAEARVGWWAAQPAGVSVDEALAADRFVRQRDLQDAEGGVTTIFDLLGEDAA